MAVVWECPRTGLEPVFAADCDVLLGASPFEWHVVYGYRTIALQAVLYQKYLAGGPLAAPPGHSAHNFGLAIDVQLWVPKVGGGKKMEWSENHPGWVWLVHAIKPTPRLHSGVSFGDLDHIERYQWKNHKDWHK